MQSRHKDITLTGRTPLEIKRKWDGLGYGALKAGDYVLAHECFQRAEYWGRDGRNSAER